MQTMGSGWFNEQTRHSLSAKGIHTAFDYQNGQRYAVSRQKYRNHLIIIYKEHPMQDFWQIQIQKDGQIISALTASTKKDAIWLAKQQIDSIIGIPYEEERMQTVQQTSEQVKNRLAELLYKPTLIQTDPELLEIVIRADKAHYFDFLRGYTEWNATGRWENMDENNIVLQVQYKDTKNESVGKEIIRLLRRYNKEVVGEAVLYARTIPIEETSLK